MCNKSRVTLWLLAALASAQALASDIPAMPPAPQSLLVGEMLRIDAQRARAAELAKTAETQANIATTSMLAAGAPVVDGLHPAAPAPGIPVPGLSTANPDPVAPASLSAIYGVGTRLYADVRIAGQTVTYAAGRAQPIRTSQPRTIYRLRAIRPPCVHLNAVAETSATSTLQLCLGDKP